MTFLCCQDDDSNDTEQDSKEDESYSSHFSSGRSNSSEEPRRWPSRTGALGAGRTSSDERRSRASRCIEGGGEEDATASERPPEAREVEDMEIGVAKEAVDVAKEEAKDVREEDARDDQEQASNDQKDGQKDGQRELQTDVEEALEKGTGDGDVSQGGEERAGAGDTPQQRKEGDGARTGDKAEEGESAESDDEEVSATSTGKATATDGDVKSRGKKPRGSGDAYMLIYVRKGVGWGSGSGGEDAPTLPAHVLVSPFILTSFW